MKLTSKIHLFTSVLFICLLIIVNSVIYFSFKQILLTNELDRTVMEATQKVKGFNEARESIPMRDLLRAYLPLNGMLQIVHEYEGNNIAITVPGQENLLKEPVRFYQKETRKIVRYNDIPHAFVTMPIILQNGEIANLQLTENLSTIAHHLRILKYLLMTVTLLASIPIVFSTRLLSKIITNPILSLIKTMQHIRKSGQHQRIILEKKSTDELSQLGETFNEMIGQLKENFEKQEQFVANASHELKTPLTVIEAYANLLKRRGKDNPELFDESIEAIHSEATRMKELIQQLLLLAKHDEQWNIHLTYCSLTKVVEESIRSFQAAFKRTVNLSILDEQTVETDPQKLKQLLYILIDNARKYSDDAIDVHIMASDQGPIIEIIDKGIGIPKNEQRKVFDRFYRVDEARTRKSGGFGLGLPLATEIAEAIGAQLRLFSQEGIGTTVQIIFISESKR